MADSLTSYFGFVKPEVGASPTTWGTKLNSDLDAIDALLGGTSGALSAGTLTLSNTPAVASLAFANSSAGAGHKARWALVEDISSETGGNSGSNLSLNAYDDTGALLTTPLSFNRASGSTTVGEALAVDGAASFGEALTVDGAATFGSTLAVVGATSLGTLTAGATTAGTLQVNGAATFSAPLHATATLQVDSTTVLVGQLLVRPGDSGIVANVGGQYISINGSTSLGSASTLFINGGGRATYAFEFYNGAVRISTIDGNGNYAVASDYRLKTVHGPVEDVGAMIDAVPVYDAEFKASGERYPMFLAHELQAACPFAVQGEKDATENGEIVPQMISNSQLVSVLWAEIQNLRRRVAALEG